MPYGVSDVMVKCPDGETRRFYQYRDSIITGPLNGYTFGSIRHAKLGGLAIGGIRDSEGNFFPDANRRGTTEIVAHLAGRGWPQWQEATTTWADIARAHQAEVMRQAEAEQQARMVALLREGAKRRTEAARDGPEAAEGG